MTAPVIAPTRRQRAPHNTSSHPHRPDIEGLRAVAVVLVVLFHAGIPGLQGGFIGVDIFFVVSGFLICGMIYDEIRVHGRLRIADFYARRARRILPAAAAVIIVVTCAAWLLLPPLRTVAVTGDVVSALLYVANWRFIFLQTDYLHQGAAASPLEHFWSLAVEEQFYLLWPFLYVLAGLIARRLSAKAYRAPFYITTIVAITGSLGVSIWLTQENASLAYLATFTRAWQFAAGALAALLVRDLSVRSWGRTLRYSLGAVGLALAVVAALFYDDSTPYPGVAALLPTVGVAVVMLVGGAPSVAERKTRLLDPSWWLSRPAMTRVGSISYSWYLWHWPAIVFASAIAPDIGWPVLTVVAFASLAPAWVSLRLLENPVRLNRTVRRSPRQGISVGVAASLLAAVVVVITQSGVSSTLAAGSAPAASGSEGSIVASGADPFASDRTSGAVTPSPLDAAKDTPDYPAECIVDISATDSPPCTFDEHGASVDITADRVVLLGDSHAGQWYPLAHAAASRMGADIQIVNKVGCTFVDVAVELDGYDREYRECDQWRKNVLTSLQSGPVPRAIFVSTLRPYYIDDDEWVSAMRTSLAKLSARGVTVYYIVDTPYPNTDVPTCISAHLDAWESCALDAPTTLPPDPVLADRDSGEHSDAYARVKVLDLNPVICPDAAARKTCPVVRGGVLLYRDESHLTDTAARTATSYGLSLLGDLATP